MTRLFSLPHAATTDDWYTPAWIFEGMAETFALDVCTPPGGVPWIPAKAYYTPDDDGLLQPWYGFVWCNPPYSSSVDWCLKWADHGNGIILIRADLSLIGPIAAFAAADAIFVPTGRLQFENGYGERRTGSKRVTFSTVLLGAGTRAVRALTRLDKRGVVRVLAGQVGEPG